jgi:uncharacterized protein YggU (UPF0235/DUF167 family)
VRVTPGVRQDALGGVRDGVLLVRLAAPPVEGRANAALLRYLGRLLGVPPSALAVARGAAAREKLLRVSGLDAATVRARVDAAL